MSSTDLSSFDLQLLRAKPILFEEICLVYSPTLGEIEEIGEAKFLSLLGTLVLSKKQIQEQLQKDIDPLFYILAGASQDAETYRVVTEAFSFFLHENVSLLFDSIRIQVGSPLDPEFITMENYPRLQELIRHCCFLDRDEGGGNGNKAEPLNERAKEIAGKLRLAQEKVQKIKDRGQQTNETAPSLLDYISSFVSKSPNYNFDNIWNLTYYVFRDQMSRNRMYEEYESNLRAALAGAKIDSEKTKYWIRNIPNK